MKLEVANGRFSGW